MQAHDIYVVLMIILMSVMVLLAVAMTIIVVMQSGNSNDLGAITGSAESFFGKNKAKSMDAKLKRITVGLAIGILINSILFFVFYLLNQGLTEA